MVLQAIAVLDPLAPLCWRDAALFPDALGPVLAATPIHASDAATHDHHPGALADLIESNAIDVWSAMHHDRSDMAVTPHVGPTHRVTLRLPGWAGGLARLVYGLNPLLPCRSPLLGGACVVRLTELLPALERANAVRPDRVLDREIGAFIAAHLAGRVDVDLAILAQPDTAPSNSSAAAGAIDDAGDDAPANAPANAPAAAAEEARDDGPDDAPDNAPGARGLAQLRILAQLQDRLPGVTVPNVAQAARGVAAPALAVWRNRSLRAAREAALLQASQRGDLTLMLAILDDRPAMQADRAAARTARSELQGLDHALSRLAADQALHPAQARLEGGQIAGAVGIMALVAALLLAALG
jgi:hypothetical protein